MPARSGCGYLSLLANEVEMPPEIAQNTVDTGIGGSPNDSSEGSPQTSSIHNDTSIDINNKRTSPRREITRTVHMGTGLGPSLECELKDISATGARLRFNDPECAPQEFLIRLNGGLLRWCQVIWRSETEIGIRFIKIPKSFRARAKTQDAPLAELATQSENNGTDSADEGHSEGPSSRHAGAGATGAPGGQAD
jgi:PilZ domain